MVRTGWRWFRSGIVRSPRLNLVAQDVHPRQFPPFVDVLLVFNGGFGPIFILFSFELIFMIFGFSFEIVVLWDVAEVEVPLGTDAFEVVVSDFRDADEVARIWVFGFFCLQPVAWGYAHLL